MRDGRGNRRLPGCKVGADVSERDQVRRGELETSSPGSSAVKGLVDPPSPRFQTGTKAPGFTGVIRAVRICHCSFPMRSIPDS